MVFLILTTLFAGIPLTVHGDQAVTADAGGGSLFLGEELISSIPGCGGNVVSAGGELFWKECPPGDAQRVIRLGTGQVFSREYFSGPFESPEEEGFIISVPGEILLLDPDGAVIASFITGEYPGSLCPGNGFIWFVSSRDGVLRKLNPDDGTIEDVHLDFTPLTVEFMDGRLLLESAEGAVFVCSTDGAITHRIPGGFMPAFTGDDAMTICRWSGSQGCQATDWELVTVNLASGAETSIPLEGPVPMGSEGTDDPAAHFDVPYMHQRWDTPDWFNGSWSCGPTSCMMAAQYYQRLTPDSIWCSYPEGHWSQWGNYIPVEYTFLGHTYDVLGLSPGSVWVPGAHGFICRNAGGAYWSYMILWMEQHGLDSDSLGTTWSACTTELNGDWPVVASTTSPYTGGHILLFNGYYDNHSVICNDAYGDQNEPGWGSYYNGKDVVYDWPGYNNGNVQLGISQLFRARSEVLEEQGTLIDDRTHGYRKLGPCQYWHEQTTGYGGYSWWTYSTGAPPDTCIVEWIPELPGAGTYTVETYVPASHANATGIYHLLTQSGWETAYLNQSSYSGEWAALGSWTFTPSTAMIRMGDYTGTQGQYISFDAVRFTLETGTGGSCSGVSPPIFGPAVNPMTPDETIEFHLPEGFPGRVSIYDTAGRLACECQGTLPPGTLAPGIYFAMIQHNGTPLTTRFTILP